MANQHSVSWRYRLNLAHLSCRMLATVTAFSVSLGVGLQSVILNEASSFMAMLIAGVLSFAIMLSDYQKASYLLGKTDE